MDVKKVGNGDLRIVLVPGGPGLVVSSYQELISLLAAENEVVTYEQRGNYHRGMDDFPLTELEYADELVSVVKSIGGPDKPTLLFGHSLGGAVAIEAMLQAIPFAGALIANSYSSGTMLRRGINDRIDQLPEKERNRLAAIPQDDEEEMNRFLAEVWYPTHFCRINPWPESLVDAIGKLNPRLMAHFIGTSLVKLDGVAAKWDAEARLHEIRQPVLVISGRHDYYREEDIERMAALFGDGTAWISETASHTPWLEDSQHLLEQVNSFLDRFR